MPAADTLRAPSTDPAAGSLRHAADELANALTHGVGSLAALVGGVVLVSRAALHGSGWQLAGAIVFAISLLMLYSASTLYHAAKDPVAKIRFKVFDHCAIYLLIAGTYTPFTLTALRGPWGWGLFAAIWALAAAGIGFKLFFTGRFKRTSTALYIAMGWIAIIAIRPLLRTVDATTLAWMLVGGVAYTLGTVFYLRNARFSHAVWHLFCVAGSTCHYVAVMRQVT